MPKPVTITVEDLVFERLETMARERGMSRTAYVRVLFEAAYAARCSETPDRDLNACVAGTLILSGAGLDTAAIAANLKCSEATVVRIRDAWREHRRSAA